MAILVKHSKVSAIPDDADTSLIRPSDWNADHTLTGTIDIANGGTGQTTANAAFNALAPSQTGNTGKYLTTNGTDTSWATNPLGTVTSVDLTASTGISVSGGPITTSGSITVTNTAPDQTVVLNSGTGISTSGTYPNFTITNTSPSLGGDVVGPASATDNAVARFDTTTGKLIQNSTTTIDDSGVLSTAKGLIGSGANFTDYPNAQVVSTQSKISGYGHNYRIGLVGEAQGNNSDTNQWGVGVYGKGWTNGDTRCAGLEGDAGVTNSADTGTATAIRAYSKSTHSGGLNVGLTIDVTGSSVHNYALYMQNGDLFSAAAQSWELVDGSNSALRFNATGKSAIFDIITTNGAEGIATSGALGVTGTATLGALGVTGTSSLTNLSVTGTTSFDGSEGSVGQVLTSAGTGATPTWTTPTTGTVTSVSATAGTGISVSGSPITSSGTLTITNTAPDQTVAISSGTGISVSGTYPSFTVTNTSPSLGGTVTSITAGTGLTGGTITTSGTIAIDSTVVVTSGSYANPSWITSLDGSKITGTMDGGSF